jgi:methyltransferase (TIGR00027 family)
VAWAALYILWMEPGRASQTAVLVGMGRAAAHGRTDVARFSDPTAMPLLPDAARARVERFRSGPKPRGLREGFEHGALEQRANMMVARTVAIDDAIREASAPQLVILGAGLDGRAWRMPELRDAIVFEVDHPDSQREKKQGVAQLSQLAREVRFTAVDFERDDLDAALAAVGHDPKRPTTWVWEGVVMYLERVDIEKTLGVIARRSAPRSRLIVVYHSPALTLKLVAWLVRRLGEPLRTALRANQMRALLAKHGFAVARDDDLRTTAASLSPTVFRATRFVRHMRTVVADKA